MKVLYQSRSELRTKKGGDTIQMDKLAMGLKKFGVEVDINNKINQNLDNYDIVHIFNINHIVEFYPQIINAKKQNKKIVLSPIYHSVREIEKWEEENSYGFRKVLNVVGIKNQYLRDHLKNLYRIFFEGMFEKLHPLINQIYMGTKNQQRLAIELADIVLVQTKKEYEDIKSELGIGDFKYKVVVNGVDSNYQVPNPQLFINKYKIQDFFLEVGRIEPRKNQLKVIEAVKKLREEGLISKDTKLVFIGDRNKHHQQYFKQFKKELENNDFIVHLGYLEYEMVQSAMATSRVHIYPSWFETTGLVAIEALLAGTRVVVSGTRVYEYVKEYGEYAEPSSVDSIAGAIIKVLKKESDPEAIRTYILENFTWDIASKQSFEVYKNILND